MATMLRIDFLQQWGNLSDPQVEDMRYDSASMRRFARIDLLHDTVPDETTICTFRHLLEAHQRAARMCEAVKALLEARKLLLKAGTIVDATIIGAPSSTKNATQMRDPEMRQTKNGNQRYFGMQVHVGTARRGVIHRQWGFTTVRYRGLAKTTVRVFALGMLANPYRRRHRLLPQGTSCRRARRCRPPRADTRPLQGVS